MASLQVRSTQASLPVVRDILTFAMLRSLRCVNVMADLVKQHSAKRH
jgi:hypothetical protein